MRERYNHLGQRIGFPVEDWQARRTPPRTVMEGRYCRVEPIDPDRHAGDLHQANLEDVEHRIWTYLPYGPFSTLDAYQQWLEFCCLGDDPLFYAIVDVEQGKTLGVASYLRINPDVGVIEVGHINFSPALQRTRAATEAMFLMMCRVFEELGYRRYEWKCDALNAGSQTAAERLGFQFEGVFRQATIYKDRNRDTAWYAIIDKHWPVLKQAFERWLNPRNFDAQGQQQERLSDLIKQVR